jgi:hypothetical protein
MIQRKQSIFLLMVLIIAMIQFFLPFQTLISSEKTWFVCLLPGCSSDVIGTIIYVPMIFNLLIVILTVVTIFIYKNRVFQYKLANLSVLFNLFMIGFFFLLSFANDGFVGSVNYQFGAFLPAFSAIFAFFAAHFIKKDELLVRSADRIR